MPDAVTPPEPDALSIRIRGKHAIVDRRVIEILGDVELDVARRQIVAVLGSSGAGKTSLLRAIGGLDTAFDGEIRAHGEPIAGPGRDRGLVFQDHRLLPWMTVAQNVAYALPSRRPAARVRQNVGHVLDLVGLGGFGNAWPKQLSGGMAQRAALARALVTSPDILLLDEPLGALDHELRIRMQSELERIILAKGLAALLVTHDVDEAITLADRVVVMAGPPGRIVAEHVVDLPRPRNAATPEVRRLRTDILTHFTRKTA